VCNYDPHGNIRSQFKDQVLPASDDPWSDSQLQNVIWYTHKVVILKSMIVFEIKKKEHVQQYCLNSFFKFLFHNIIIIQ